MYTLELRKQNIQKSGIKLLFLGINISKKQCKRYNLGFLFFFLRWPSLFNFSLFYGPYRLVAEVEHFLELLFLISLFFLIYYTYFKSASSENTSQT